jgi:hypothetical protein
MKTGLNYFKLWIENKDRKKARKILAGYVCRPW